MTQVRHQNQISLYRGRCQPEMTQKRLAVLMDTSPRTIQTWEEKGVAKVCNLLGLVEVFVTYGAITNYEEAKEFWKRGSQREAEWEAPNKLAALFATPSLAEPPSILQHDVSLDSPTSAVENDVGHPLDDGRKPLSRHAAFLQRIATLSRFRLILVVMTVFILCGLSASRLYQPNGPRLVPLVSHGQLAPELTFQRGGSLESHYSIPDKNTLVIAAGPHTDQHTTNISAPVVTLPMHGDFDVSVHLTIQFSSPQCCQHAGIGVRSPADPTVWIRITRDHARVLTVNRNRGEVELPTHPVDAGPSIDLRIQRTGNQFLFFYREAGDEWIPFTVPLSFELPQDAEIYLVNYSMWSDFGSAGAFSNLVLCCSENEMSFAWLRAAEKSRILVPALESKRQVAYAREAVYADPQPA